MTWSLLCRNYFAAYENFQKCEVNSRDYEAAYIASCIVVAWESLPPIQEADGMCIAVP